MKSRIKMKLDKGKAEEEERKKATRQLLRFHCELVRRSAIIYRHVGDRRETSRENTNARRLMALRDSHRSCLAPNTRRFCNAKSTSSGVIRLIRHKRRCAAVRRGVTKSPPRKRGGFPPDKVLAAFGANILPRHERVMSTRVSIRTRIIQTRRKYYCNLRNWCSV